MPDLFGLDIQGIVATALASSGNLRPGVLTHYLEVRRSATDPTETTDDPATTHAIQGFVAVVQRRSETELESRNERILTIIGGSIVPFVDPVKDDKVELDKIIYTLGDLRGVDPAKAVYEFVAD